MNKVWVLIFWFVLLLSACNSEYGASLAKPDSLVGRDTMIKILTEIHLAESGIAMMGIDYNRATALYQQYHREILGKYKLDTAQYRQSYEYYMQSTVEMEYILTLVEDSLVRIQASEKLKMGIVTPKYNSIQPSAPAQDTTAKKAN
jgi:hypothetical protein